MRIPAGLTVLIAVLSTSACAPAPRELRYPDGGLYEVAQWRGPVRHGWRRNSFPNGVLEREVEYRDGEPAGMWSFYAETGTLSTRGRYDRGRRTGAWLENHPNGARRSEGEYVDGEKHGLWRTWDETGALTYEEDWAVGTLLRVRRR